MHPDPLRRLRAVALVPLRFARHRWITPLVVILAGLVWIAGCQSDGLVIRPPPLPAESVTLAPTPATVAAFDTILLEATVRNTEGQVINFAAVTWTSGDPAIATAASYQTGAMPGVRFGTVLGVSPSSVTITATSGTASASVTVTVGPPVPVASVTVTPGSPILTRIGETLRLSATLQDANRDARGGERDRGYDGDFGRIGVCVQARP